MSDHQQLCVEQTSSQLMQLAPHVWPASTVRDSDGVVFMGGVSLVELAHQYGTPLFVIDQQDFHQRCQDLIRVFGGHAERIHYAAKAFFCRDIARWVKEEGLSLDVASGGELAVALRAGFPPERITMHGNNKSTAELVMALEHRIGHIVLDSLDEIDRLEQLAAQRHLCQPVFIRVTVGVHAHTHQFIATAHEDQKFGLSLASGAAAQAVQEVMNCPHLQLVGLHSHIGSQIFDLEGFRVAAHRMMGLISQLTHEYGPQFSQVMKILDLGGGFGIAYRPSDPLVDVADLLAQLQSCIQTDAHEQNLQCPQLVIEPGRWLIGPTTVTVYEVGTVKDISLDQGHHRRYISVDGGMSDNIRPALYGADYDIRLISRISRAPGCLARIVGKHCESGDILVNEACIPEDVKSGDLVAIAATGAYCYSMSSRYNLVGRPAVVAVTHGTSQLMLRRETVEDLMSLEVR